MKEGSRHGSAEDEMAGVRIYDKDGNPVNDLAKSDSEETRLRLLNMGNMDPNKVYLGIATGKAYDAGKAEKGGKKAKWKPLE